MPLAVLAAAVGTLVFGSLQGQVAAANAHHHVIQLGGLALGVDEMGWMSNDMTGQGPVKNLNPHGFKMDSSMMPGMQPVGDDRLRFEVNLQNVSGDAQRYTLSDFSVVAPGGQSWQANQDGANNAVTSAVLEPRFGVTLGLYFDIPSGKASNLAIRWSRGGSAVEFPVDTNGVPAQHIH